MNALNLYRFYGEADELLYVGISVNAAMRSTQHKRDKEWWPLVARMEVEHLHGMDRKAAEEYERRIIVDEHPIYNIAHNGGASAVETGRLAWLCEVCGQRIDGLDGYVELPWRERQRYVRSMELWLHEFPNGTTDQYGCVSWEALAARPSRAHWWAIHRSCDPEPNGGGYHFAVDEVATPFDLIAWTAHLQAKRWIDETDWDRLLKVVRAGEPVNTSRNAEVAW